MNMVKCSLNDTYLSEVIVSKGPEFCFGLFGFPAPENTTCINGTNTTRISELIETETKGWLILLIIVLLFQLRLSMRNIYHRFTLPIPAFIRDRWNAKPVPKVIQKKKRY